MGTGSSGRSGVASETTSRRGCRTRAGEKINLSASLERGGRARARGRAWPPTRRGQLMKYHINLQPGRPTFIIAASPAGRPVHCFIFDGLARALFVGKIMSLRAALIAPLSGRRVRRWRLARAPAPKLCRSQTLIVARRGPTSLARACRGGRRSFKPTGRHKLAPTWPPLARHIIFIFIFLVSRRRLLAK